jgi:hypothetical protein
MPAPVSPRLKLYDPTGTTDWCALLAQVQTQYIAFMTGQATQEIDTPMLGRVAFNQTNVGNIERIIALLADQCALQNGQDSSSLPRGPISLEAEP